MRVLIIHNRYQYAGGEDAVFEAERKLLVEHGHTVETVVFDNRDIATAKRNRTLLGTLYNRSSRSIVDEKIRRFCPDVMHVHNFIFVASPSIFYAAADHDIPTIVTLHNYRLLCPGATLFHAGKIYEKSIKTFFPFHAIMHGVYRQSRLKSAAVAAIIALHQLWGTWQTSVDRYIVLTKFEKKIFGRSKFAYLQPKMIVKSNFVNDTGAGPHERQSFFLFVGRLSEEKGVRTLLRAAASSGFELWIGGDGPLRSLVEEHVALHSNIHYRGALPHNEVIELMKNCKALIFPSQWYEGFPVTILESFCSGTPVIASALGSMEEIVNDGWNGRLFKTGDDQDLVRVVKEISNNTSALIAMQSNARADYLSMYTPRTNYLQLIHIYQDAISSHQKKQHPMQTRTVEFPSVTIGIPTYNGGSKVRTAVESIMAQNYPAIDIMISDNCSNAETATVCQELVRKYPSIRYYRQEENVGILSNFQFLLDHAGGKYFMWLADDDALPPNVLHRYVAFMERKPDYSLVSGAIQYSLNGTVTEYEEGFDFTQKSAMFRVPAFYFKVVHGALFHGMMRTKLAKLVRIRHVIGSDWHFVATMAYLGKVRNLPFVGYYKKFGGSSRDMKKYARMIGESEFAGKYPFVKIATDAFREIASRSNVFSKAPLYIKYPMAVASMIAVLASHYLTRYPFILGGRLKRSIKGLIPKVQEA